MKRISLNKFREEEDFRLNGKPKHIKLQSYDEDNGNVPCYGNFLQCCGQCCGCMRTWLPCLCCWFIDYPYKIVPQSYSGIYQKFGKYKKTVKPGLHFINPCSEELGMINLKINVLDLEKQNLITRDNVSINLDASVYYQVVNARYAYYRVQQFNSAIAQITYAIIKNTCGKFKLQDLLEKRKQISDDVEKQIDQFIEEWGVDVVQIFIKDIQISEDLQQALSCATKQRKVAQSKLIEAKANVQAAKLMRLAAQQLNSQSAMQIRYLEVLKKAQKNSETVIMIPNIKDKEKIQHIITQGFLY